MSRKSLAGHKGSAVASMNATRAPLFIAMSCIGFIATPAMAEDSVDADSIIVRGQLIREASSDKSTAPLLDTPQTVTVINSDVIRDRGATTLTDVLRNTPGISFNAGENGFSTSTNNFSMRGFDSSGNVFIDGSRDSGSYPRDVFNIDRVEVFKGATSDNGRGSAGGYVNIVSKTAQNADFLNGTIAGGLDDYGTRTRLRGNIDVNQAVGEGVALRINAVGERAGVPGRNVAERELWGIAPSVAGGLGTNFRAILSYEHLTSKDVPDWGVPGAAVKGLKAFSPATDGFKRDSFYGLSSDIDNVDADAVTLRLEHDLAPNVTLSNQTRWAEVTRFARYTVPTGFTASTGVVGTQTQFYDRSNETITNATNLSAGFNTGGLRHKLSAGVEFTRETSDALRGGTINSNTTIFNPNPKRSPAPAYTPTQANEVRIDTLAFYLYDTLELSPKFEVTGGIRGENYDVRIDSFDIATGAANGAVTGYDHSTFALSGRVGAVYKPVPEASIYVSYGNSAQSAGSFLSNPDISRTGDNAFPGFVPGARTVRSENYEVGVHWNFLNDALTTSLAAFRTEKSRVPVVGRRTGQTVDTLQGYHKQVVQGVEASISGQITPAWSVFGGLLVMESERKISAELNEARRNASPGDYGTYTTVDGDRLAFTPNLQATLWTNYRFPFGLSIGGGVQHNGSSFFGRPDDAIRFIPNGQFGKLPAYTLVNALVAYDVSENVTLRLNIDNLLNETYAVSANWNGSRATLGAPRTYLMSAGFRF